jgi:hypothetical protein
MSEKLINYTIRMDNLRKDIYKHSLKKKGHHVNEFQSLYPKLYKDKNVEAYKKWCKYNSYYYNEEWVYKCFDLPYTNKSKYNNESCILKDTLKNIIETKFPYSRINRSDLGKYLKENNPELINFFGIRNIYRIIVEDFKYKFKKSNGKQYLIPPDTMFLEQIEEIDL